MAREQTVFSELAVARGISKNNLQEIKNVNGEAITKYNAEKNKRITSTDITKSTSEAALESSGLLVRNWLLNTKKITNINVEWIAGDASKDGSPVAKDLIISNTNIRVSVKENAQLFQNPSPVQVFQKWPQGILFTNAKDEDWFIKVAEKELNDYFVICGGTQFTKYKTVKEYYKNVKGKDLVNGKEVKKRKLFTEHVAALHVNKSPNVISAYKTFCKKVSEESAKEFNKNILATFPSWQGTSTNIGLLTNLFSVFFKLDNTEYVLAGTENNKAFAVVVHDITTWRNKYSIKKIEAIGLVAGQPEVLINFEFIEIATSKEFSYGIKCEVRWSHGKFCGNPESKLYKYNHWKYEDLPWVNVL
jgi:hypothetical protein